MIQRKTLVLATLSVLINGDDCMREFMVNHWGNAVAIDNKSSNWHHRCDTITN